MLSCSSAAPGTVHQKCTQASAYACLSNPLAPLLLPRAASDFTPPLPIGCFSSCSVAGAAGAHYCPQPLGGLAQGVGQPAVSVWQQLVTLTPRVLVRCPGCEKQGRGPPARPCMRSAASTTAAARKRARAPRDQIRTIYRYGTVHTVRYYSGKPSETATVVKPRHGSRCRHGSPQAPAASGASQSSALTTCNSSWRAV